MNKINRFGYYLSLLHCNVKQLPNKQLPHTSNNLCFVLTVVKNLARLIGSYIYFLNGLIGNYLCHKIVDIASIFSCNERVTWNAMSLVRHHTVDR